MMQLSDYLDFLRQPGMRSVWVQTVGRLLYLTGYTALQFYIPLVFVNQLGLSATTVGIALGSGSLAGVIGHMLGGYLADAPAYGRKRALLFAAALAIAAAAALALTHSFALLVVANLLMGLSAGCYWTASDASVVDATQPDQRQNAFALLVLADNLGGGVGIWIGGLLMAQVATMQTLFWLCLIPLVLFLGFIQVVMAEPKIVPSEHANPLAGFGVALRDRVLLLFVLVNVLFTTYIALVSSTLPLYLTRLQSMAMGDAAPPGVGNIADLFAWVYIGLGAVLQIPLVQLLNEVLKIRALLISLLLWAAGFLLVWAAALTASHYWLWAIAALALLSIAGVIYKPFAPAIVAELAPPSLRGVYLAISYQCWSIGYFIGPILGGWAVDQAPAVSRILWLGVAATTLLGLVILYFLTRYSRLLQYTSALTAKPENHALVGELE